MGPSASPSTAPTIWYVCVAGQGEYRASYNSSDSPTEVECSSLCVMDDACVAFDFTTKNKRDACRLYGPNDARIGDAGKDNRQYCAPAGPPAAPEPSMFVCEKGQGQRNRATDTFPHNSEASCAAECDEDAMCIGFDFTTNSQVDACRLYGANDPRTDGGRDNRQYCGTTLACFALVAALVCCSFMTYSPCSLL